MAKKKQFKHRGLPVGEDIFISLCETCIHMPEGKVPQSNHDINNGTAEQPFMYCTKKAYFPDVNYTNEGKPFYDVAKCDGYEQDRRTEQQKQPEIKRATGSK